MTAMGIVNPIMRFFTYDHLQEPMREVSKQICDLAERLNCLPDCPEKSAGMRKLLEAKDCFVRAIL